MSLVSRISAVVAAIGADIKDLLTRVTTLENSGGGGGGGSIVAKNEGVQLTATLAQIDFVGSGVHASATGNSVTVTVNQQITVGPTAPANPSVGDLWINTSS